MNVNSARTVLRRFRLALGSWSDTAEMLRSRWLFRSLDAAVTAPLRPKSSLAGSIKEVLSLQTSNYNRVAAAMNVLDWAAPGASRAVSTLLTRSPRLPFAATQVELMSYGSGATVFLLRGNGSDKVLKVYRQSLGRDPRGVMEVVQLYRRKYETVRGWYNGRDRLVPTAYFLIVHSPLLNRPAAAILQPYIAGDKRDIFEDFTDEELLDLLRSDEPLAEQFVFFVRETWRVYIARGLCLDFVGRDNLMLVNQAGRRSLLIIDNGIFEIETLRQRAPQTLAEIESRLRRLLRLLQQLAPAEAERILEAPWFAGTVVSRA
jgi:hypothetical protein